MNDTEENVMIVSGKNVKALREHFVWSQEKLAEKSGVSVKIIKLIEDGKNDDTKHLMKVVYDGLCNSMDAVMRRRKFYKD